MLPKIYRLKKDNDFKKVFQKGKLTRGKFMDLRFVANNLNFNRFGFLVGLKISKKAVERNKIKRRLTELAGQIFKQKRSIKFGYDVVVLAKPSILAASFNLIKNDFENLIKKVYLND